MDKKMTIFYKKRNLLIDAVCEGVQDLTYYGGEVEDMELIYGYIIVEHDKFILKNNKGFYLDKDENGNLSLKIKSEFKEQLSSYI